MVTTPALIGELESMRWSGQVGIKAGSHNQWSLSQGTHRRDSTNMNKVQRKIKFIKLLQIKIQGTGLIKINDINYVDNNNDLKVWVLNLRVIKRTDRKCIIC